MQYKSYILEIGDPEEPDSAPLEVEVFLISKGGDTYEVFDVGVPWFFVPFRQGDTISVIHQSNGNLAFVDVTRKSENRVLRYQCTVSGLADDALTLFLGDYNGGESHWDPTPQLSALLDRLLENGGNCEFVPGSLTLYLPPGVELTSDEADCLEEGEDLLITTARFEFNKRSGRDDPSVRWTLKIPD